MKKLASLLIVLSLGLFTVGSLGCAPREAEQPIDTRDETTEPTDPTGDAMPHDEHEHEHEHDAPVEAVPEESIPEDAE